MWAKCSLPSASSRAVTVVPIPASLGLMCTSSDSRELAVWISSAEDGAGVAVVVVMVQVDHVQHGGRGGDIAAGMATHAVGHDGQVPTDIGGVVILGRMRPTSERAA